MEQQMTFKEKLKYGNALAVMRRELEDIVAKVDQIIDMNYSDSNIEVLLQTKAIAIAALMENERFFLEKVKQ